MTIQERMNELFESKIISYSMDLLENKFILKLELLENGIITNFNVEFINVSTFYFINNTTEARKVIYLVESDDYLELTSMNLSNDVIDISLDKKKESWLQQYDGHGKVILEIWSKLVVLEAEKFSLNGDEYIL